MHCDSNYSSSNRDNNNHIDICISNRYYDNHYQDEVILIHHVTLFTI